MLVLAPVGRDGPLAARTLAAAGLAAETCADVAALCRALSEGTGCALVTQEALRPAALDALLTALDAQPPWSDVPLIVLVSGGAPTRAGEQLAATLGQRANATLLERPVRATTLVGVVRVALRARRRQYELRDHLAARAAAEQAERRARAVAEEAVRVRDEFLSSVAHDLKNPLSAIKGYAQLLRRQAGRMEGPEAERMARGLATIESMVVRAVDQVDELLDVARLQIGQPLQLELGPTDVVGLARRLAAVYEETASEHRVRVVAELPELFGVWDGRRLARVLDNLLSNAVKYSPGGGEVTVEVALEETDARAWAVVRVSDQGIGIPAADRARVFGRFWRAGNAAALPGTGLGLAGVKQVVEQHGGSVHVESEEGRGSTFTVRLPLVQTEKRGRGQATVGGD